MNDIGTEFSSGDETKPRLGDYYARLSDGEWNALFGGLTEQHRVSAIFWGVGWRLFCKHHTPLFFGWWDFVKASDAFAFGALKYAEVGGWRRDPLDHHFQAAGRHFNAWLKDPASLDAESGLTHEAHFLARALMIQELRTVAKGQKASN